MTESPLYLSLTSEEPVNGLIRRATLHSEKYMSSSKFDSSHDFHHILRVVALALSIFKIEQTHRLTSNFSALNKEVVILGALLHDIDDRKYSVFNPSLATAMPVYNLLQSWGADETISSCVQMLVDGVSYSSEVRDHAKVQDLIAKVPELALVQDADRLDALGAIGIGRCFTFGGARGRSMEDSIRHFDEKLVKLEAMMKTETGRLMASVRTKKINDFKLWWNQETAIV